MSLKKGSLDSRCKRVYNGRLAISAPQALKVEYPIGWILVGCRRAIDEDK